MKRQDTFDPSDDPGTQSWDPRDWLAVLRAFAGSSSTGLDAVQALGGPRALLDADLATLRGADIPPPVCKALQQPDAAALEQDLNWLHTQGCDLLPFNDDRYPPQLQDIPDPPLALYCRGNPQLLWLPQIAIVGTRQPTSGGRRHAQLFAKAVAEQGLVVTSGLALGIDGEAHQAALDAGGLTIAVAATGLDRIYPARHQRLGGRIAEHGLIISEFPPGWEPRRRSFPQRNRVISGLAIGVLVVEASVQSGSLITARLAAEQGREVYALPGSIDNPMSRGCHQLIRQGARLIEDCDELMGELAPRAQAAAAQRRKSLGRLGQPAPGGLGGLPAKPADPGTGPTLDADYQKLLEALGFDELSVDLLVEATGLTAASVSSMLLILELGGLVQMGPGGGYSRTGEGWQ